MKNKIFHALMVAMGICFLLTGTVFAATYTHIGPGSTVGGVNVSTSSYITTSSYSFLTQGDSTAWSSISRMGGNTFASRKWCGGSIRNSANHGGWVGYNVSSKTINGGLVWGARCTDQSGSTAAQHDFSNAGETWQPYFYSPLDPRP